MDKDDIAFMLKLIVISAIAVLVLGLCGFVPILSIGMGTEAAYCNNLQTLNPDLQYRWLVFGGCMVKTPQGMYVSAHDTQFINGQLEIIDNER